VPSLSERAAKRDLSGLPAGELADLVTELTDQMHAMAAELQFEAAARIRDEVSDLKKELRQMLEATR
jgi:excinuclease ABC subunit B